MGNIAISVESLGKRYRIGHATKRPENLREMVRSFVASPFQYLHSRLREPNPDELIWALKDVSFEVKHGEVLGIIGRNGAGKSTLLKILSRITEPTTGKAKVYGRVGSLLEVGTGFHPELTGRENIYLNGAILGMRRFEVDRKFDEIVEFSGVEKFLDTPVKRYSSGMYVRLAFAVAAHLEPEILLIDEVLAVGDAVFQKKCLGKMKNVAREGRTVVFVSHNMTAVRDLCTCAILLSEGKTLHSGSANQCIEQYLLTASDDMPAEILTATLPRSSIIQDDDLRITSVKLETSSNRAIVYTGQPLRVTMRFEVIRPLTNVMLGWAVHTGDNVRLFECQSLESYGPIAKIQPGQYLIRSTIPSNPLNQGLYTLHVGARCERKGLDSLSEVMVFRVDSFDPPGLLWLGPRHGFMRVVSRWTQPDSCCEG